LGNLSLLAFQAQSNQLSGTIPVELWNNDNLFVLRLDNNNLEGQIAPEIGNLQSLQDLRLDDNEFTGALPAQLWTLQQLGTCASIRLPILLAASVPELMIVLVRINRKHPRRQ